MFTLYFNIQMFVVLAASAYSCNLLVVPKTVKMPKNELEQAIKKLYHNIFYDIFWLKLGPLESVFHVVYFMLFRWCKKPRFT